MRDISRLYSLNAKAGPYGGRENSGKWEEIGFFDDFSFPLFVLPYRWQREVAVKIALGWISLGFCLMSLALYFN